MLQNYIKSTLRNFWKYKLFSLVNIGGLAIGIAVAIVIGLWIWDEWTFNQYHTNVDRVARVMQKAPYEGEIYVGNYQSMGVADAIQKDYSDNFDYIVLSTWEEVRTAKWKEKRLSLTGYFMEADAPKLLDLNMVSGSLDALQDPNTILLSQSTATKFFGLASPLEKSIQLGNENLLRIAGVYEDLPDNSSFSELDFIAPWAVYEKALPSWVGWGNDWFQILVQLAPQADLLQASTKIKDIYPDQMGEVAMGCELFLHPMNKWYLYSNFENGVNAGGRIKYIRFFGLIGLIVMVLACINFMNLSTARAEKRVKEIGIRKTIGSSRKQLIYQFFSESITIAFFALGVALLLSFVFIPFANQVADKQLSVPWSNPYFWTSISIFTLFTACFSAIYPALYLSSFKPANALKGKLKDSIVVTTPSKILAILQFTVSIIFMIGTAIVFSQIQYAKERSLGYSQDQLIEVAVLNPEINRRFSTIRNELLQDQNVASVALSGSSITQLGSTNNGFQWEGKPSNLNEQFWSMTISNDFGKTIDWNVVAGRDFNRSFNTDSSAFVINQAMADYLGFENPVGKVLDWGNNGKYSIIGVVENMVMSSPYESAEELFFMMDWGVAQNMIVRVSDATNLSNTLSNMEQVYKKYDPNNPFTYEFVDQRFAQKFGEEERIGRLAAYFAGLSILISCLGLFAMITYIAERRTKEIGIRKILGASVTGIVGLLSHDFIRLVLIAFLIATPIAYYFMDQWLQDFAYRIELQWWVFALAGVVAISIALLTVSVQSVKAALANPVNSLRNE